MQCLFYSGIVHHMGRGVPECGPVENKIGSVMGLYITQQGGLSACLPRVIVILLSAEISSKKVTTNLIAVSAKSFPLLFV